MLKDLLGFGIGAISSIVGGGAQSKAADKAAQAEIQMAREAQAAREAAAQKVQGLQAPGVAAYNTGLNALGGRLGLAGGTGPGGVSDGKDYAAYVSQNPDIAAEAQRVVSQAPDAIGDQNSDGRVDTTDYGIYHAKTFGDRPVPSAQAAPQESAAPAPQPGTYGNALNPTYTAPTYTAPAEFSFDINSFKDNPAYKFAQEQGSGQVMANASATGALQSGAALKALQDRGQKTAYGFFDQERDFAFGQYTDARNFGRSTFENDRNFGRGTYENDRNYLTDRYDRTTDDMFRYTGLGQNALNATTNAIIGEGNATATGLENIGQSRASNALTQGNIWSGVAGDVGGALAGLIKPKAKVGAAYDYSQLGWGS